MYLKHFGLAAAPFSIAPDPRYLYLSQRHQEALAHLLYGVNCGGGFVLLTGEVGSGKTTICRCLLEQVPENCDVAYIFNPKLSVAELLSTICLEFGISCPADNTSIKVFVDHINAYLLVAHARHRHAVLIIDEAQNLPADVLEQMRLLTNLETNERKLLQIILLGQPELATMLARPELRQLAQRVVARYHLGPLTRPEVASYVRHRLEVSGTQRPLFSSSALERVYRLSGGIPRVINVLCDRALLGAFVQGRERIDRATLSQAAREVLARPTAPRRSLVPSLLAVLLLAAGSALAVTAVRQDLWKAQPEISSAVSSAVSTTVIAKPAAPARPVEKPAPVAVLPEVLVLPEDAPRERSRQIATAALFGAWDAEYLDGDPCKQSAALGLQCQVARGGLDELRRFNRPAMLQMRDAEDREFDATLIGLDDQTATFKFGTRTVVVSRSALAGQWSGHFTLLWRLPADVPGNIRPGQRGPAVEWLRRQLALIQPGVEEAGADPVLDEALVRHVKQFQLAQGLVPDGTLGPVTLLRLSRVADQTAPRLVHTPVGK